jgi:hypothetical protein
LNVNINVVSGTKSIDSLVKKLKVDVPKTVLIESNEILDKSKAICPVITGFLKSSGNVKQAGNETKICYDAHYAIYVHERPNFSKGYKWLINTFSDNRSKLIKAVEETLK